MFVRIALALVALATSCRTQAAPELVLGPVASSVVTAIEHECARLLDDADLASAEGRHQVVVAVVNAVRAGRCDPIEPEARVCRSLFLIGATDPLVGVGVGLSESLIDELVDHHAWVLEDGAAAAADVGNERLVDALGELASLDLAGALGNGPDGVAAVAIERADPSIIAPLIEAETLCHSG